MMKAPAVKALAIQFASFLIIFIVAWGLAELGGLHLPIAAIAVLQGTLAAATSRWRGLAVWWLSIQFLFPIGLVAMQSLNLPPAVFLFAFIFFLTLYWTTYRTQVPFFPSRRATWESVADLLPQNEEIQFIDIGSGLGGLVMHLAGQRPESVFTGIEIAPLPWMVSLLRARVSGSRARFVRGDYTCMDFACYSVVFAFLSPAAMQALGDKARAEMRSDTLLLSYEFPIPGWESHIMTSADARGAVVYGWRM